MEESPYLKQEGKQAKVWDYIQLKTTPMNAFSEKSDLVLRTVSFDGISVNDFTVKTNINKNDAVVTFLKNAGFLSESDLNFLLTEKGKHFLSTTSFVEQRNQRLTNNLFYSNHFDLPL